MGLEQCFSVLWRSAPVSLGSSAPVPSQRYQHYLGKPRFGSLCVTGQGMCVCVFMCAHMCAVCVELTIRAVAKSGALDPDSALLLVG